MCEIAVGQLGAFTAEVTVHKGPPSPGPSPKVQHLEDLLTLAVALLADERGISIEQVRERLWKQPPQVEGPPSGPRLLRIKGVREKVGFSLATIYRWMREGTFPRPVKVGHGSAWRESDIDAWVAGRQG